MSENENVAPPILDNSNIEKVEKPSEKYTRIFTKSLISKQDCGIFKDLILKPDLIIDGKNYFFSPEQVKIQLENLLTETLNKYPYMFEPIRADLIKYSKDFQTEEFKSNIGFLLTLKREMYFYWYPKERNEKEWIKAKKIAFLLSQLNSQKNKNNYNAYIAILHKIDEKFSFDNDKMFQMINMSLSFNSNYDDNVVIMELSNKMENIKQEIYKTREEKKIQIYINYLISIVERKISDILNSYKVNLLNEEAKMTLYKIYDNINLLALRFNFPGLVQKKFFYDLEFDYIKIIKDNEKIKEALIENGNLNSFIEAFQEEFECIKAFILPIDEDDDTEITYEDNNIFEKKCLLNIQKLNEKKYVKEDKINDIQNERLIKSLESAKKIVSKNTDTGDKTNTGNNTSDGNNNNLLNKTIAISGEIANISNILTTASTKIKRLSTEEIKKQINYWKKLRNISLLLNKIKNIQNKAESFKGLIITQKFVDDDDTFLVKIF